MTRSSSPSVQRQPTAARPPKVRRCSLLEALEQRQFMTIAPGAAAPDFSVPLLNSKAIYTRSADASKVQVFDFFATWCGPCRSAIPMLQDVANWATQNRLPVSFHVINDESSSTINSYFKANNLSLPVLSDQLGQTYDQFGVTGIPTTVIISNGKVQTVDVGFSDNYGSSLKSKLQDLVGTDRVTTPTTPPPTELPAPPTAGLSVTPVVKNGRKVYDLTLTGRTDGGSLSQICLYTDSNGNGRLDDSDRQVVCFPMSSASQAKTVPAVAAGRYFAKAFDTAGQTGASVAVTVPQQNPVPVCKVTVSAVAKRGKKPFDLAATSKSASGSLRQVCFYADTNRNGKFDPFDRQLICMPASGTSATTKYNVAAGTYFAVAYDRDGQFGTAVKAVAG